MARSTKKKRVTLTQADVIAAAHRLMERSGAGAWSMRTLARELSVSVSTLYWHVRDKRELLKLTIDDALATIEVADTGDWRDRLAELLRQGRDVLRARPALIALIWGSGWELGASTLRVADQLIGVIAESGLPEDEVADAYFMVVAFLFGFVAMETLSPDTPEFALSPSIPASEVDTSQLERYRPASDLRGMERRFERGIAGIVNGLEASARAPGT